MPSNPVVDRAQWTEARKALLAQEKALTRQRDAVSAARRAMPWVRVNTDYVFDTADGSRTLADLFAGCSQLITYHFMYGADWEQGCPSCSLLAEGFDGALVHLNHRDVSLVAVSNAPIEKLHAYRARLGWAFPWVSSLGTSFNRDYHVSFEPDELAGEVDYNFGPTRFPSTEAPGISVFTRDEDGAIYHSYSAYARGLDTLMSVYHFLDLVPKGRDEDSLPWTMAWLRRNDEYED